MLEAPGSPGLAALHVEEHDDEEEERDDRARVDQDEQEGQEVGVKLHEEARDAGEAQEQAHRRVDRVLAQDDAQGADQREDREGCEGELVHRVLPQWCPPARSSAAFLRPT